MIKIPNTGIKINGFIRSKTIAMLTSSKEVAIRRSTNKRTKIMEAAVKISINGKWTYSTSKIKSMKMNFPPMITIFST